MAGLATNFPSFFRRFRLRFRFRFRLFAVFWGFAVGICVGTDAKKPSEAQSQTWRVNRAGGCERNIYISLAMELCGLASALVPI